MHKVSQDSFELIANDLGIESEKETDQFSEQEMIEHIAARVQQLIDREPDLLFSYLYRLDVSEHAVNKILLNPAGINAVWDIATLIWHRQLKRLETKKKYKQDDHIEGWEW